jgi:hypothetical protein
MRAFIRRWLGLKEIHNHLIYMAADLHDATEAIDQIRNDLAIMLYDEHDPRRKAASDRIGQRQIERIKAAQKVRDHYGY